MAKSKKSKQKPDIEVLDLEQVEKDIIRILKTEKKEEKRRTRVKEVIEDYAKTRIETKA